MQLELPVDGQGVLRWHHHVLAAHRLRVQVRGLHRGHLAVVVSSLSRRIPPIRAQGDVEDGAHGLAVVLIHLDGNIRFLSVYLALQALCKCPWLGNFRIQVAIAG